MESDLTGKAAVDQASEDPEEEVVRFFTAKYKVR
jgi:hypothetical protein